MSIVTVAEFKAYAKKLDGDTTGEVLYQMYLDSAETVVTDHLTYSPAMAVVTQTFYGDGKPYLQLRAKPIVTLSSITVDGVAKAVADFSIDGEMISEINGNPFAEDSVIVVTYAAGYTTIPGIIKLTILEIASLLAMEAGENIGVTSQSFDGGNSRTFMNYTRFDKYLAKLYSYRIIRLPQEVAMIKLSVETNMAEIASRFEALGIEMKGMSRKLLRALATISKKRVRRRMHDYVRDRTGHLESGVYGTTRSATHAVVAGAPPRIAESLEAGATIKPKKGNY